MKRALLLANQGLRFLLELCVFAAWAVWGAQAGQGAVARVGLGFVAALVVIVFWGSFFAPRARFTPPLYAWVLIQVAIFAVAVVGLATAGHPALALALALLLALNSAALFLLGDSRDRHREGADAGAP